MHDDAYMVRVSLVGGGGRGDGPVPGAPSRQQRTGIFFCTSGSENMRVESTEKNRKEKEKAEKTKRGDRFRGHGHVVTFGATVAS